MGSDEFRDMEREIVGAIWTTDEPYQTLRELCDDIGHRFGGSESERLGAEFLKQKMLDYGLENVRIEEFPMAGWERGSAALKLIEPVERDYTCVAMPYCPSADLVAEIVDVGEGELADFERLGEAVRGKIVISAAETNKPGERTSHRTDKFGWAIERGALGYIYINQNPGMLHITGSITGRNPGGDTAADREAPIPGVGVSWEAGSAILRLMERGGGTGKVHLRLENRTFESTSRNVIGEIVGSEHPDEIVLMGGHFDGHDISQGAGDDGAGAVTGIEAARALARFKGRIKRTIRVICFGSEEIGLLGAFHHAKTTNPDVYRFVMNLDGAGRGKGGQEQLTLSGWPELSEWFGTFAEDHHYSLAIKDELNSHSDHYPFALRGIPNGTVNSRDSTAGMIGRGWGHTEADTFDKIHLRGLQMSAILVARLMLLMAQADDFPATRRSEDEVREQLKVNNLLERAEKAGRFPPVQA
ncbi:MAG TPA: M28 family peptidase [Thermomicrobiales bacterium]|nr:M28 family peptidase [Thermomicrobiales bacterium]